ncbi:MAG: sulfatase-like hydrolase/transferase [Pirellulaceae bacterium]|nr:sulfatase-like hydrolase/transferase [Pirellulaceae bacterium]
MMYPRRSLLPIALLLFAVAPVFARQPNVVFVLVDDLGYMDIGANNPGTFYETPNVDRLAATGMRFTNGYAANPVCSPTRFSIMTGRYPSRVDATDWFVGRRSGRFLPAPLIDRMPLNEVTLAEAFAGHGYRTAFLGKWHLGPTAEFWPENQGFQINVAGHNRGSPPGGYFAPFKNPRLEDGPEGQHLTQRLTDEALEILDQFGDKPFLLYLSFYTVHTPLQAPKDLVAKYQAKAQRLGLVGKPEFADEEQVWPTSKPRRVRTLQRHATYAAMVETMDTSVGRVLAKLKELGIEDFQFDEFSKLRDSIRSELNKEINLMIEEGGFDRAQLKTRMTEIQGNLVERFRDSLLPAQADRLRQVAFHIQMRRRSVIDVLTTDPLAKQLELTEAQKKALRTSAREIEEEFAEEVARLREQAKEKLFSNLSKAQQKKLSELLGEEFTLSEARQGNLLRINSSVPSGKQAPAGKPQGKGK